MSKPKPTRIPFDSSGNLIRKVYPWVKVTEWKDNFTFHDTLKFERIYPTSNSGYAIFNSIKSAKKYYMSLADFNSFINKNLIKLGICSGEFSFRKRGRVFGIVCLSASKLNILSGDDTD